MSVVSYTDWYLPQPSDCIRMPDVASRMYLRGSIHLVIRIEYDARSSFGSKIIPPQKIRLISVMYICDFK